MMSKRKKKPVTKFYEKRKEKFSKKIAKVFVKTSFVSMCPKLLKLIFFNISEIMLL